MSDALCEVCGAPATTLVADLEATFNRYGTHYDYRIHSKHAFCDEHDRQSITHEPTLPFGTRHAEFMLGCEER